MTNKRRINSAYLAVLALCLFVFGLFGGRQMLSAFAEEEKVYSNVLADLQKDKDFTSEDYPKNATDYSLQVIQIAESTNGELFIYVYSPCANVKPLIANEINMSLSESVDDTKLYSISLLNKNGVFGKYLVNGVLFQRNFIVTTILRAYSVRGIKR